MSESFRLAWPLALEAAIRGAELGEAKALLAMVANAPPEHVPPYISAQRARYGALIDLAGGDSAAGVEADLRSAIETFRILDYVYWLARAKADLARWLRSQGQEEAKQLLAEARDTFTQLGAQADLARALG
jgi:hypothetical protein